MEDYKYNILTKCLKTKKLIFGIFETNKTLNQSKMMWIIVQQIIIHRKNEGIVLRLILYLSECQGSVTT